MRTHLAILLLFATALTAPALEVYVQLHQFNWVERDQDDQKLLEESGPLLGFGLSAARPVGPALTWLNRGEGFLGEVDYDGANLLLEPVRTTTAYYGLKGETELRWTLAAPGAWNSGPLGGLSTRAWLRQLDHSERNSNGYDEAWWLVYGRAGWFAEYAAAADTRWFAEGALRLPVYNYAKYSLTGADEDRQVAVEPGRELSYEAAAGLRKAGWTVALTYEDFSFGRSDPEALPPFEIFQPASEGRVLSLRVGLLF